MQTTGWQPVATAPRRRGVVIGDVGGAEMLVVGPLDHPATTPVGPGGWAARWVGVPWADGQGCWRLALAVWRDEFGWPVPDVPVALDPRAERRALAAGAAGDDWQPAAVPRCGDAVLMARRREPCHVGVFVAPRRVLHAQAGSGAVCVPLSRLPASGWHVLGVWRWRGAA